MNNNDLDRLKLVLVTVTMSILLYYIAGCSVIAVGHREYCQTYTTAQRMSFRILAGGNFKVDCKVYTE